MDFETRVMEARRAIRAASIDGVQRRTVPFTFEVRNAAEEGYKITGHAAVFDSLSENLGGFREKISPGAFTKVLDKSPDVRALYNHDQNYVLARSANGTLSLAEDETGLRYDADVAPTSYANDLRILLERGDVNQSSFAFRVARGGDEWDEDEESGLLIRTVNEFSALYDVSPVAVPAYTEADVGLASRENGEHECAACLAFGRMTFLPVTHATGATTSTLPASDAERNDDEAASQRVDDGGDQERQTDEPVGTPLLGIRQRRMSAAKAMGLAPESA